MISNYKHKLKNIKAFVLDVDGVLTNGELYIHPDGKLMRKMNAKDGYILKLATQLGYKIAIITGGREQEIKIRLKKLYLLMFQYQEMEVLIFPKIDGTINFIKLSTYLKNLQ